MSAPDPGRQTSRRYRVPFLGATKFGQYADETWLFRKQKVESGALDGLFNIFKAADLTVSTRDIGAGVRSLLASVQSGEIMKRIYVAFLFVVGLLGCASMANADCLYEGKSYGEGSPQKLADGKIYFCRSGKWEPQEPALIAVEDSAYGTECCGAMSTAANARGACDGKPKCSISATNQWAGRDPVPNKGKHLWVRYHCTRGKDVIQGSVNTITVQENAALAIECNY